MIRIGIYMEHSFVRVLSEHSAISLISRRFSRVAPRMHIQIEYCYVRPGVVRDQWIALSVRGPCVEWEGCRDSVLYCKY